MNSSLADQASEAFARSLLATPGDEATRIREAYRRAFGRVPTSPEIARVRDYLQRSVKIASGDLTPEEKQLQAWRGFCRVLFASTEFTFVE